MHHGLHRVLAACYALFCSAYNLTGLDDGLAQVQGALEVHKTALGSGRVQEKETKPIIWLQLHGMGGFVCQESMYQGEYTGPHDCALSTDRCLPSECRLSRGNRTHCLDRKAMKDKYTFTVVEREVSRPDLDCWGVLYGIMLREPLALALSTLSKYEFDVDAVIKMLETGKLPPKKEGEEFSVADNYQFFDNFVTRILSGKFNAPPGELTADDLVIGKKVIKRMDVILILDDLKRHLVQLAQNFGWDYKEMKPRARDFVEELQGRRPPEGFSEDQVNQWKDRQNKIRTAFTASQKELFKNKNGLDYELFQYGRDMALRRSMSRKMRM